MSRSLAGKVALVTGGSRGIGRAIAQRLAADGALVAVHYGRQAEAAAAVVAAIEADGGQAFALGQPLGVAGDVAGLFGQLDAVMARRTGSTRLDILVNNAGVATHADLAGTTSELFDEHFAINARAPFFITQAAAERMDAGGRVITIGTGLTKQVKPELVAYAMSKAAIDVMSQTLAKELAPRGITVNVVAPGVVDTDMNAGWLRGDDAARAHAEGMSPFGRLTEPEDVASVVAFAASDDARFVTGQFLDATGGAVL
ncbi:Glucose 1-dehydrogenase 1 [Baekduia alba]|uniref:SDR family oxidoreductase n=1 Tax=Baekduia alba TaxID=2997333 RepID=UPI00234123A6|nr:SDR family oxidoreductase [Baekduia alba]WCB96810.1 Glucose 1-dehydrogenase 1 [Baekduia alba]